MKSPALSALGLVLLSGCVSMPGLQPPAVPSVAYVPSDHDAWRGEGTATITGQAFLRQQGGGVVTCAGNDVLLVPKSAYFDDVARLINSGRKVDTSSAPVGDVPGKKSQCDAQGNFRFEGLPAASWYVVTNVNWTVGYAGQGGELVDSVVSEAGKNTTILLTDKNRL